MSLLNKKIVSIYLILLVTAFSAHAENLLPEPFKHLNGRHAPQWGPNCHNTALVFSGLASHLRFTEADEILFWLSSPLCREVRTDEKLHYGDIGQIWSSESSTGLYHSFIHISTNEVFSKRGVWTQDPFLLEHKDDLFKEFIRTDVQPTCLRSTRKNGDCRYWVSYFRCKPLAQYLAENSVPFTKKMKTIAQELSSIEQRISQIAMREVKAPPGAELRSSLNRLQKSLESDRSNASFLHQIFGVRIISLKQQIQVWGL
ncbi:MAG: hypothetical protein AB1540_15540 [Bdellovibrionota bacterium]